MSWFLRGAQSAAFYYLSCTPFFDWRNERKRLKENRLAKAAKASEKKEDGEYIQSLPFESNPYWHEEMVMGPGPKRGRASKDKNKTESTRRLNTGGQDSSTGGSSFGSTFASSLNPPEEDQDLEVADWNKKRYQRQEEYLWGSEDTVSGSYASVSSRGANKPLVSGKSAYYNARNAAQSELHPPIISSPPTHQNQALWMLQPPPPAKVMEGRQRATKTPSLSNASYQSSIRRNGSMIERSSQRKSKQIIQDLPDDMSMTPPEDEGIVEMTQVERHDMAKTLPTDISILLESEKNRPHLLNNPPTTTRSRKKPQARPPLSTITSAGDLGVTNSLSCQSNGQRPTTPLSISSLQILQDLAPSGTSLNIRPSSPSSELDIGLPTATELETEMLALPSSDSKFPGNTGYQFPGPEINSRKSVQENINPSSRWSMDI
jgi:hypothetical protein